MSSRPWKDRQFDASRLVVAKPGRLGRGYAAGQRYRPEREAISPRRVRQLWDQRVLVTDDEWRRTSKVEPVESEPVELSPDWIAELERDDIRRRLLDLGRPAGKSAQTETLRQRLRDALEA